MSLFNILEGIIGDKENRDENLKSADSVMAYADACGESITAEEAGKIIKVGKSWLDEQDNGNGEWSRMRHEAKAALEDV